MTKTRTALLAIAMLLGIAPADALEVPALTAPGVSRPIEVTRNPIESRGVLPGIYITFAPGTVASCTLEATMAEWTSSGLPSTAAWQNADPSVTNITASTIAKLGAAVGALRLRCTTLSSGSVTLATVQ